MADTHRHGLISPPASAASPSPSVASGTSRHLSLPTPRAHRLRPGSQKEIALINYLDDKILRITRRYAKKFSNEVKDNDDTPGYTTYHEFVEDADPLVDIVWISGTPTLQVPYLLSLAGQVCSYLQAFPFSTSLFSLAGKIDQAFASLLQPTNHSASESPSSYHVSMTDRVRMKSLVEETRVAAVNAASASGHTASLHELSEDDSEEDEDDVESSIENINQDSAAPSESVMVSLQLSKIYKRTLEILGDSLITHPLPQHQAAGTQPP